MAGETTTAASTTSIGTSIPVSIQNSVIAETRENGRMLPFVDFRPLVQGGGLSAQFPRLTTTLALTAITSGTAEADAVTATTLVTAVATATAATKAAAVLQSWISKFASAVNWDVVVPQILGRAAADLMDVDAMALLGGGTNTVGTSGVGTTFDNLRVAAVTLRRLAKNLAGGGIYMLAPYQIETVDASVMGGSGIALNTVNTRQDILNWYGAEAGSGFMDGYRGTLFGRPVFDSTNVPDANSSADHAGAIFVPKAAFGGVYGWLGRVDVTNQASNFKLADGYLISCLYGFIELFDTSTASMLITIIGDHV